MSLGEKSPRIRTRAAKAKNGGVGDEENGEISRDKLITDLSELSVGMRLEAMDKYGKWYVAKVMEIEEEEKEVLVHFEKWSSRYDEFIPLNSGRLHFISHNKQEEMEKEKEKIKKQLTHGDRVQAKWTDGRMYYGTVVKLNDGDVDLLFDDGVTYTAPLSHVRKRLSTQPPSAEKTDGLSSTVEERRFRAEKRKRNELSPSPCSSLASSTSKKRRPDLDSSNEGPALSGEVSARANLSSVSSVTSEVGEERKEEEKDGGDGVGSDNGSNEGGVGERGVAVQGSISDDTKRKKDESFIKVSDSILQDKEEKAAGASEGRKVGSEEDTLQGHGLEESKVVEAKEDGEAEVELSSGNNNIGDLICGEQGGASYDDTGGKQLLQESKKQLLQVQDRVGGVGDAVGEKSMVKIKRRSKRVAEKWGEEKLQERKSERRSTRSTVKRDKEENTSTTTGVSDEIDKLQLKTAEEARSEKRVDKDDMVDEGEEMDVSEIVDENSNVPLPTESSSGVATLETNGSGLDSMKIEKDPADCAVSCTAPLEKTETAEMETDSPRQGLQQVSASTSKEAVVSEGHLVGIESAATETTSVVSVASKSIQSSTPSNLDLKSQQQEKESSSAKPVLRSRRVVGTSDPQQEASVVSRTRSRTSSMPEKDKSVGGSSSPGNWDHNEYKCKYSGCSKSFRKSTLLASHVKHYHASEITKTTRHKKSPAGKAAKLPASLVSADKPDSEVKPSEPGSGGEEPVPQATPQADPKSNDSPHPGSSLKASHSTLSASDKIIVTPKSSKTASKSSKNEIFRKLDLLKKLESSKKLDTPKKGDGIRKQHGGGAEVVSIARVSLKALPPGGGRGSGVGHKDVLFTSSTSTVTTTTVSATSSHSSHKQSVIVDSTGPLLSVKKEEPNQSTKEEESSDDVVHCVCGSNIDEGFMIQCEECLCWQHGDCVGIRSDILPKKYTCFICVNHPGIRTRLKYKYSHDWYGEGSLPSLPGGAHFPAAQTKAVLVSHELKDGLYRVKKMMHGTDVKLQAASNPHHPYLKQWSKECSHYDRTDKMAYSIRCLAPFAEDQGMAEVDNKDNSNVTGKETGRHSPVKEGGVSMAEEDGSSLSTQTVKPTSECEIPSDDKTSAAADISPEKSDNAASPPLPNQSSCDITSTVALTTVSSFSASPSSSTTHQASAASTVPVDPRRIRRPPVSEQRTLSNPTAEPSTEMPQEELMEFMNQDEFGVSEVPVFAVDPNKIQHPASSSEGGTVLPSMPVVAASAVSVRLGGSGSSMPSSSTFSSSSKSAFKPVATSTSSPSKVISSSTSASATATTASSSSTTSLSHTSDVEAASCPSPLSSTQPVTVGKFSEDFLKKDTTNWFRRMKLLDHIEEVQDNMATWLNFIEERLADLPDDNSETTGKALSDLQSSVLKLKPSKMTA